MTTPQRFCRALLALYPAGFRAEYGDELCATFAERTREQIGTFAPVLMALAAIADVVPNALAAHWDIPSRRPLFRHRYPGLHPARGPRVAD